jgi:LmbE family N-acetylglucosaminyl deacetylase
MENARKLMFVVAHPDDESLGAGGAIAKYASDGVDVYLITATRGEYGWPGSPETYPGPDALAEIRQEELHSAARILGVREGAFLDYIDGQVNQANSVEAIAKISEHIRRLRPEVIVTFDPFGIYGHPDHIAIGQFTHAAILRAASEKFTAEDGFEPHLVLKLYYMVETQEKLEGYQTAFQELVLEVNGQKRKPVGWEPWAITTRVPVSNFKEQVKKAVQCHRSQFPEDEMIERLFDPEGSLWEEATFYRAYSLVSNAPAIENDLFDGLN